jgi:hypothetical protein
VLDSLNRLLATATPRSTCSTSTWPWRPTDAAAAVRVDAGRRLADAVEGTEAVSDSTVVEAMRDQHTVSRMTTDGTLGLAVPLRAGGRSWERWSYDPRPGDDDIKILELLAAAAASRSQRAPLPKRSDWRPPTP